MAQANTKCTIVVLLPSKPCDVYVENVLLKRGVVDTLKIETPNLPAGSFKYTIVAKDSTDQSKSRQAVVTGIVAGGNLTVDMRTPQSAGDVASL